MSGSKPLADFLAEAAETAEALARGVAQLDQARGEEPDPGLLNAIFRSAHSLKGIAALFGQERIAHLAHAAEDLLDRLRLGQIGASDEVLNGLADALDVLQGLLEEASRDRASDALTERAQALRERLASLASAPETTEADPLDQLAMDPSLRAVLTEYEEHRLRRNVRQEVPLWKIRAAFDLNDFDQRLATLNQRLKGLGEVVSTLPSSEPGEGAGIAFDLLFGSRASRAELEAALKGLPTTLATIEIRAPGPAPASAVGRPSAPVAPVVPDALPPAVSAPLANLEPVPPAEPSLRSLTRTVRVDIERLDGLMNAVGELLLIKANVQRLAEAARQPGVQVLAKPWGQELFRESRLLERKLDELQQGILAARMVPLGQVFDKLARLVRRIAREGGKEIDFPVSGGEVELDKLIVEELSDPLMHILRNAIDHGIESPDRRSALSKPRRGRVSLKARQEGAHVLIEVADDGSGIDHARVKEVAVQRHLITPEQARELSPREVLNLIFLPGFSTARAVSELSGRGVGLDVVKNNIAYLSGIIDVDTARDRGTTFLLTLPLTLAIIRALVVSVSQRVYAVPLNSVLEITSVREEDIRTIERREVMTLRGQTLPLLRLGQLFRLPESRVARHFVVVVGLAQQRLGIMVDELAGQQDIVTKPLGGRLRHVPGISGATDLGNRRTVLVLDVAALVEEVLVPDTRARLPLKASLI